MSTIKLRSFAQFLKLTNYQSITENQFEQTVWAYQDTQGRRFFFLANFSGINYYSVLPYDNIVTYLDPLRGDIRGDNGEYPLEDELLPDSEPISTEFERVNEFRTLFINANNCYEVRQMLIQGLGNVRGFE